MQGDQLCHVPGRALHTHPHWAALAASSLGVARWRTTRVAFCVALGVQHVCGSHGTSLHGHIEHNPRCHLTVRPRTCSWAGRNNAARASLVMVGDVDEGTERAALMLPLVLTNEPRPRATRREVRGIIGKASGPQNPWPKRTSTPFNIMLLRSCTASGASTHENAMKKSRHTYLQSSPTVVLAADLPRSTYLDTPLHGQQCWSGSTSICFGFYLRHVLVFIFYSTSCARTSLRRRI